MALGGFEVESRYPGGDVENVFNGSEGFVGSEAHAYIVGAGADSAVIIGGDDSGEGDQKGVNGK